MMITHTHTQKPTQTSAYPPFIAMDASPTRPAWCNGWACPRGPSAPGITFWLLRYNDGAVARLLRGRVGGTRALTPSWTGQPISCLTHSCCLVSDRTRRLNVPVPINGLNIGLALNCTPSALILSWLFAALIGPPLYTQDRTYYWDISGRGKVRSLLMRFNFMAKLYTLSLSHCL